MALSLADAAPEVVASEPFTVTKNTVTVTLDGSDTEQAFAGMSHGGPDGREPFLVLLQNKTASSSDGVIVSDIHTVSTDAANNELDFTLQVSGGGTDTETCTVDVLCYFLPAAPDVGRSAPIGYTAPGNTNF